MKPCIKCGKLLRSGSNCAAHDPKRAYRDPAGVKLRAMLLDSHRRHVGAWCLGAPEMDHSPHETNDLTVDHIDNNNRNNDLSNLRILCRSYNTRKANARR